MNRSMRRTGRRHPLATVALLALGLVFTGGAYAAISSGTAAQAEAEPTSQETIEQVAQETHRRWAGHLNRRVTEILSGMGAQVTELRFGEDLDFTLRFADGPPTERARALLGLSTGARDQLYLAIRLAISEYLSRGHSPLPLLLDDPFATSDDGRTRTGMRLLIEQFSRHHQIIVLTCHRKRHEALAQLDPELYRERVQRLELRSGAVAR